MNIQFNSLYILCIEISSFFEIFKKELFLEFTDSLKLKNGEFFDKLIDFINSNKKIMKNLFKNYEI